MKPDSTVVFTFPKKAPEGALVRTDLTAIEHLKLWLQYQLYWCEHKPSITVSVREEEWPEVGAWVWQHFDLISGVSFLPMSDHSYKQAPYEDCNEWEYRELLASMPKEINWDSLVEVEDNVEGVQTLACTGGVCEI